MPDRPTLYLIDGHAQMFRAFFAIRGGMTSPVTGEPTNALFAFTGMLLKLFHECRPDYAAIAFDADAPTFRDELYKEYKANRESPPDDFAKQIPRMFELARLFGLPLYEKPGYEADDLMATVAHRVTHNALPNMPDDLLLRLVAKDKDLEQCINDRVILYDVQENTTMDADALMQKRGIRPDQVIDYQALLGDSIDNVPGVPGIGAKTASKLLADFNSIDELITRTDELKGKQKEKIETAMQDGSLALSRRLVTLDPDVDFPFDLSECATRGTAKIKADELRELFRTLGFNRHVDELNRLVGTPTHAAPTPRQVIDDSGPAFGLFGGEPEGSGDAPATLDASRLNGDYRVICDVAELDELSQTLAKQAALCFDTETIGSGEATQCIGVSLAWQTGQAVYLPIDCPEKDKCLPIDKVLDGLDGALQAIPFPIFLVVAVFLAWWVADRHRPVLRHDGRGVPAQPPRPVDGRPVAGRAVAPDDQDLGTHRPQAAQEGRPAAAPDEPGGLGDDRAVRRGGRGHHAAVVREAQARARRRRADRPCDRRRDAAGHGAGGDGAGGDPRRPGRARRAA